MSESILEWVLIILLSPWAQPIIQRGFKDPGTCMQALQSARMAEIEKDPYTEFQGTCRPILKTGETK